MRSERVIGADGANIRPDSSMLQTHGKQTLHANTGVADIAWAPPSKPDFILYDNPPAALDTSEILRRPGAETAGQYTPIDAVDTARQIRNIAGAHG